MPYITRLDIRYCRNIDALTIEIPPAEQGFRHLILTGPNGSGKSGVLEGVVEELKVGSQLVLDAILRTQPKSARSAGKIEGGIEDLSRPLDGELSAGHRANWRRLPVRCGWSPRDLDAVNARLTGTLMVAAFKAQRRLDVGAEITGPARLDEGLSTRALSLAGQVQSSWTQYLVNQKMEQLLSAAEEGGAPIAARIASWFDRLEANLADIFELPGLKLVFDRKNYRFYFRRPDGYTFDFQTLADGHSAALSILIELTLRQALLAENANDPSYQPEGVVIIDEVEAHLHLLLQEKILPMLTSQFPRLQFIVATHSPAVISSIPDAVVYDLGTRASVLSDDLRGVRYGTLMTEHFGLGDDVDLDSARRLHRLAELAASPRRGPGEEAELRLLAEQLSERSHTLALEVWYKLNRAPETA